MAYQAHIVALREAVVSMIIDRIEEYAVTDRDVTEIRLLLREAFPGYFQSRIYYKTRPHFRFVIRDEGVIVAHMAVEYRVIKLKFPRQPPRFPDNCA